MRARKQSKYRAIIALFCFAFCATTNSASADDSPFGDPDDVWRSIHRDMLEYEAKRRIRRDFEEREDAKRRKEDKAERQARRAAQQDVSADRDDGGGHLAVTTGSAARNTSKKSFSVSAVINDDYVQSDRDDDAAKIKAAKGDDDRPDDDRHDGDDKLLNYDQILARKKEWMEVTRAPELLQDWVPQKAVPIHNGGFAKEPDNGSPVPYKLNGHVDIQRKIPWEEAN